MGGKISKSNGHMNGHSPQKTTIHYTVHTMDQLPDGLYISDIKPKTGSIAMPKDKIWGMIENKFANEKQDAMLDNPTTELGDFMRDYFRGNIHSITQIDIDTNVTDDTYRNIGDFISEVVDAALTLRNNYLRKGYGLIPNRVYETHKKTVINLNSVRLDLGESTEIRQMDIAINNSLWRMVKNISPQREIDFYNRKY